MAVNGRAKGKRLQVEVANLLGAWLGLPASEFVSARSGKKEPDVAFSQAAAAAFPYHVECKNQKKIAFEAWINQAITDTHLVSHGREPIVMYRESKRLYVCTRLVHLCWLVAQKNLLLAKEDDRYLVLESVMVFDRDLPWVSVPFGYFMSLVTGREPA